MFVMLERFERGIVVIRSPAGKVLRVLNLCISRVETKDGGTYSGGCKVFSCFLSCHVAVQMLVNGVVSSSRRSRRSG